MSASQQGTLTGVFGVCGLVGSADGSLYGYARAILGAKPEETNVIFIVVRFTIRPERSEEWLSLVDDFTTATRREPGNIFFEWSRSVDNPHQFVLVEGFESGAGEAHVNSDHFKAAMSWIPDVIAETPDIVNVEASGDGWSKMVEVTPRTQQGDSAGG